MTRKISSQLALAFYGLLEKSASTARNGLAIEHRKKRDRRCGGSFGIDANGGCSVIVDTRILDRAFNDDPDGEIDTLVFANMVQR